MSDRERAVIQVNGKSKMGKTYFVKNEIIPKLASRKPVIIFDRKNEYLSEDSPKNSWKLRRDIKHFFRLLKKEGELSGVYVIKCKDDSDYTHGLSFIKALSRPVAVVLDEAHDIFKSSDFKKAKEPAIQLARYGSHELIDIIFISQRTKDTPLDFRTQVDCVVSFRQSSEYDIKAIDDITGCGLDRAEKVSNLDKYQFEILGSVPNNFNSIEKA